MGYLQKKASYIDEIMNDIVGIIDMDGFPIGKKFYCKELGILKVGDNDGKSYFFDLGIRWNELSEQHKKTCKHVIKHVHKLPFGVPKGIDAYKHSQLEEIIIKFYHEAKQCENSTLAYKGGNFEKNLLIKLNIPHVNLEIFGCPKASQLFENLIWLETCGHHYGEHSYQHCPKVEVEAFGTWLEEKKK